ncbi:hypothetical protein SKAU_G00145670 [Synaphobranchus kaupii]|uniref:Uncharacterized protein n=1 Tax=Synaphobranchus kaupii TaxID=118154 RepID=A0A9Q1J4F0_SYNKA|nr:hypothetical protein SKAU_G00145670 [Synaphobranchus kaupii]
MVRQATGSTLHLCSSSLYSCSRAERSRRGEQEPPSEGSDNCRTEPEIFTVRAALATTVSLKSSRPPFHRNPQLRWPSRSRKIGGAIVTRGEPSLHGRVSGPWDAWLKLVGAAQAGSNPDCTIHHPTKTKHLSWVPCLGGPI